jgi:CheY-like chemotaxis protein
MPLSTTPETRGKGAPPTVLLVDDEPAVRSVVRRTLERAGFRVIEASGGDEALVLAREPGPIDAVILDVLMPTTLGGEHLHPLLLEIRPELRGRLVFFTGVAEEGVVQQMAEELDAPLHSKLDDLDLLLDSVRLALHRSDPPSSSRPDRTF